MTRVELHGANVHDYNVLHEAMESEGFSRLITSDTGTTYHLPEAEYYRVAELTRNQVLDSAKSAAGKTHKTFAVTVTESKGVTWHNLPTVKL